MYVLIVLSSVVINDSALLMHMWNSVRGTRYIMNPLPVLRVRHLKQYACILQHSTQRHEKYIMRANPSVCGEV